MRKEFLVLGVLVFALAGIVSFISAAAFAPTGLAMNNNVTADYDEGNFSLNWTAGGSNETVYTIWIYTSGGLAVAATNDSATGYTFQNSTEENYTFIVGATDGVGYGPNSSNISVYVDRTAPSITLPVYTNATVKKSTEQLTLNVLVSDASSGVTGSVCTFDINGTNVSSAVSSGWCNGTVFNLTGLSDGNRTIKVYVNDTVNILGLNNSFAVWIDTTGPTAVASCSPSTIQTSDNFPCTCSGTDASAGLNDSLTAGSSTSGSITVTSSTGVFTYTCSVTDLAGNTGTATATYTVNQPPTTGSSSGTTTSTWMTNSLSDEIFSSGYTGKLSVNNRLSVQIGGETHYVGVLSLTSDKVTVEISSDPVKISLAVGEDAKVDVNNDGFYDVYVLLNGIENGQADLTVQKISEEISSSSEGPVTTTGEELGNETSPPSEEDSGNSMTWIWILIVVLLIWVFWKVRYKK